MNFLKNIVNWVVGVFKRPKRPVKPKEPSDKAKKKDEKIKKRKARKQKREERRSERKQRRLQKKQYKKSIKAKIKAIKSTNVIKTVKFEEQMDALRKKNYHKIIGWLTIAIENDKAKLTEDKAVEALQQYIPQSQALLEKAYSYYFTTVEQAASELYNLQREIDATYGTSLRS